MDLVGPGNWQEHKDLLAGKGVDFEKIIELRHDLHKHPEPGFKEFETQKKIRNKLIEFGVEEANIRDCAGTGLVVDIKGTAEESKDGECNMIAYRADIDALPMKEENPHLDYCSVTDAAHMCGHDGHICTLLATAQFWTLNRDKIPSNKTIRLLFQPAEESPGGAEPMIKEGCLEGVDEVYGYHNVPFGHEGTISIKSGPLMAGVTKVIIEIEGQGGHGSEPALSIDPITAACQLHSALHTIKSRKIMNTDVLAFTICEFLAGSADNVIPRTARMRGTIRYFDEAVKDLACKKIEQLTSSICDGFDCKSKVTFIHMYPATINHEKQTDLVVKLAKETLGSENVNTTHALPWFASEDFSFFLRERPGAFILLNNVKEGEKPLSLHSSFMNFNDNIISTGALLNIKISEDRLGVSLL